MRHTSRLGASRRYVFLPVVVLIFSSMLGQAVRGQAPSASSPQLDQRVTSLALPGAWNDGVKTLTEKIAAVVKPSRAISLEIKNISSLDSSEVEAVRVALEKELTARGLRVGSGDAGVEVTLSENVEGYLWVAKIGKNDTSRIELVLVTKANDLSPSIKPIPLLQRKIVWRQATRFLDFSTRTFSPGLLDINYTTIFEFGRVRTFEFRGNQWSETQNTSLPLASGVRDPRGLLVLGDDGKVYVGKEACLKLFRDQYCGESLHQDWPFPSGFYGRFVGNRNYFAGFAKDSSGRSEGQPFYTVAIGMNVFDHYTPIVTAELDGVARLYSFRMPSPEATFDNWGDDIASIKPSCGADWQVLVTGRGDWTELDHIQVYAISFGDNSATAKPEGQPLEFSGPIFAIWQADDEKSARVMSKNLQTGMYEASIVTVICSQ